MKKTLVIAGFAILFVLAGCGNKTDQQELDDANTLTTGILAMMINVDEYSTLNGAYPKPGIASPPFGWNGPAAYSVPWSSDTFWYWTLKIPFTDTLGQDTAIVLGKLTPDIWDTTGNDTAFVTKVELALWRLVNQDLWFYFELEMAPTDTMHISGGMKWNFHETWLDYDFTDMGCKPGVDESGIIDVTTSNDIRLSAHFEFIENGSGTGWGKFQNVEFVHFTFFDEPDENDYEGYYELASEGWKVKHYFPVEEGT